MLDLASRYRETFLFNIWRMGMNSIEKGSRDNWTVTPKRIAALEAAAAPAQAAGGGRGGAADAAGRRRIGAGGGSRRRRTRRRARCPAELYNTVLHDPKLRDPRGYIIPPTSRISPRATKFVNALLKNGITVLRATAAFTVAGKSYPAGSYVVKTAQAFRPHVMDMFEPQDHPNDFPYPGGPPKPPYDITGWTLAYADGRAVRPRAGRLRRPVHEDQRPAAAAARRRSAGPRIPAGYLISHQINNSFKLINRLLKANCDVYWMKKRRCDGETGRGRHLGAGLRGRARRLLEQGARRSSACRCTRWPKRPAAMR